MVRLTLAAATAVEQLAGVAAHSVDLPGHCHPLKDPVEGGRPGAVARPTRLAVQFLRRPKGGVAIDQRLTF